MEQVKYSTIGLLECKKHLNIEESFTEDDSLISICLRASKEYVKNYTALDIDQLDNMDSIVIAVLVLVSDFYSRRSAAFGYDNNKINFILKSILDMNRRWL